MSHQKQYNFDDFPVSKDILEETPLKAKINIEQLVFRQIERTFFSATQSEELFAANVRLLLSTCPANHRDSVLELSEEYTSTSESWQYKYFCGVPLGTVEHPINGSPYKVEEEVIDWHKLFELILAELEICGVTWKVDHWTIDGGKIEPDKPLPSPTPVFTNKFAQPSSTTSQTTPEQTQSTPQTPQKNKRPCAICEQHVFPGTGMFFKNKLVHKETCLEAAKAKWVD